MLDGKQTRIEELVVLERTDQLSHVVVAGHRKLAAAKVRFPRGGHRPGQQESGKHESDSSRRSAAQSAAAPQVTSIAADSV